MGGGGESFATCCAVFSVLGVVHLLLFAYMFSHHAVSFAIMGVERRWNLEEKAKSCYMGAVLYGIALFISVVARVYLRREGISRPTAVPVAEGGVPGSNPAVAVAAGRR